MNESSAPYLGTRIRTLKIYTRTGDKGSSSLFTGERRSKSDEAFHALGTVDELSSCIGMALAHIDGHIDNQLPHFNVQIVCEQLQQIQCRLQDLSSAVATPLPPPSADSDAISERSKRYRYVNFSSDVVSNELEPWIDSLTASIPPLRQFILPSGGIPASALHYARAVCRRAERCVVAINLGSQYPVVEEDVIIYLNRLSDYLFTAARYVTVALGFTEKKYTKPRDFSSNHKKSDV